MKGLIEDNASSSSCCTSQLSELYTSSVVEPIKRTICSFFKRGPTERDIRTKEAATQTDKKVSLFLYTNISNSDNIFTVWGIPLYSSI